MIGPWCFSWMRSVALRLENDLDATVLLVAEGLVELGSFSERRPVRDDERGIDLALFDSLQQRRQVVLDRCLRHAEGQAPIDRRAHRNLVEEAAIDADDRDSSEVAAAMDSLAQDMRAVGPHEGRDLHAVDDGIEARRGVRLRADRIDAGIRAAAIRHVLDAVVDILFLEIE